ncbi:MAG: GDP-L-fucose synthase [Deltaproteobacteria bacterium]|nr:GDP-L-fucose synthase [Deltaproteobacteria bacterium]
MNKRIIITGSDGLIGSAFRRMKVPSNVEFTFLNRSHADLRSFTQTLECFKSFSPDAIIHLAAKVGGIGANSSQPGTFFHDNILINTNVLEAARQLKVKKLVSFLSTCVFPNQTKFPMTGNQLHDGIPHESNFGYAHAKRMLEVQARAYRKEFGCSFVNVVGTNLYGPNDNFNLKDGHAVASLIHKIYLAKKNGQPLSVWGTGKPLREFVFADDVAKITYWALENYDDEEPLMMSSGVESSIKDLVGVIADKFNFKEKIIWDDSKQDGQLRKPSDDSKLKKLYPDMKFTNLAQGIEKTVAWFEEHYPNIRN